MTVVYVSVGNSDDKLTQREWSALVEEVDLWLFDPAVMHRHGYWLSSPDSPWQNACWCVELDESAAPALKSALAWLAGHYRQESIAWAEAPVTVFLGPDGPTDAGAVGLPVPAANGGGSECHNTPPAAPGAIDRPVAVPPELPSQ